VTWANFRDGAEAAGRRRLLLKSPCHTARVALLLAPGRKRLGLQGGPAEEPLGRLLMHLHTVHINRTGL
jgi:hypothetical protein